MKEKRAKMKDEPTPNRGQRVLAHFVEVRRRKSLRSRVKEFFIGIMGVIRVISVIPPATEISIDKI
ncbi:MAG: hypothetical protein IIU59_06890 [Alistipes sp.]|nr:hypothetical protein [Alistipes sp.]